MSHLKPKYAAELAQEVYKVQTDNQVIFFMSHPVFSSPTKNNQPVKHKHLKAEVGGRVILNFKDGFGICAEGTGQYEDELFLVFRGTTMANKKADVLTDARIGITSSVAGLPVHIGFNHCFMSMLSDIRKFMTGFKGKRIKAVHCIGHSLGGAIASLAADWVARSLNYPTRLYTFGQPRVGTDWFVKSTTGKIGVNNIHRVYHRTDPVPMVPLYPFMHAPHRGNGHYINSNEALTSGAAHKMAKYINSVKNSSWKQLSTTPEEPYTIESAIEAWLKSKSPVSSSSATIWRWIDAALIYVLKKVAMGAILGLQAVFIGTFTIADKIAYILAKGIKLAEKVSYWVERLMHKIMQVLKMRIPKSRKEMTQALMKKVLARMSEKANSEARNAMQNLDS